MTPNTPVDALGKSSVIDDLNVIMKLVVLIVDDALREMDTTINETVLVDLVLQNNTIVTDPYG